MALYFIAVAFLLGIAGLKARAEDPFQVSPIVDTEYCLWAMNDADLDRSGGLNEREYVQFAIMISQGGLPSEGTVALSLAFMQLACLCQDPFFGGDPEDEECCTGDNASIVIPESPDESDTDQVYLFLVCDHTFDASEMVGMPSSFPTKAPTSSPTAAPVVAPTLAPTQAPSKAPTMAPTEEPSKEPTAHPFSIVTHEPTTQQISTATDGPTSLPLLNVSHEPTVSGDTGEESTDRLSEPTMAPVAITDRADGSNDPDTNAIVGGIVATVALICLTIAVLALTSTKKRKQRDRISVDRPDPPTSSPNPTVEAEAVPVSTPILSSLVVDPAPEVQDLPSFKDQTRNTGPSSATVKVVDKTDENCTS